MIVLITAIKNQFSFLIYIESWKKYLGDIRYYQIIIIIKSGNLILFCVNVKMIKLK